MTQSERTDRLTAQVESSQFQKVARALCETGYRASVEYPGFVQVTIGNDTLVNVGTANGHWGYDVSDGEGYSTGDGDFLAGIDAPLTEVVHEILEVLAGLVDGS